MHGCLFVCFSATWRQNIQGLFNVIYNGLWRSSKEFEYIQTLESLNEVRDVLLGLLMYYALPELCIYPLKAIEIHIMDLPQNLIRYTHTV